MEKLEYDTNGWARYKLWWVQKGRDSFYVQKGDHPHDPSDFIYTPFESVVIDTLNVHYKVYLLAELADLE